MEKPKYNILDTVYHITPESPKGIVLNIKYLYLENRHEYLVSFGAVNDNMWCYEHELTTQKTF